MSGVRLPNELVRAIVLRIWPEASGEFFGTVALSRLYGDVRDVIDDLSVPTVSRANREAILKIYAELSAPTAPAGETAGEGPSHDPEHSTRS